MATIEVCSLKVMKLAKKRIDEQKEKREQRKQKYIEKCMNTPCYSTLFRPFKRNFTREEAESMWILNMLDDNVVKLESLFRIAFLSESGVVTLDDKEVDILFT
jgi:hypothetical protein